MDKLIKIKEVSTKYDITARTLRYYEDMGLLTSTRSDDVAYRLYDETAIQRLEQILILRKLNISIKDIQKIFAATGSEVVLEVLGNKVQNIDNEVSLLHELKEIILDFIQEIERVDFAANSAIKNLYDKAKEIETQFGNVNYIGKPSNINRLVEITEKLDKKIPDVMIVRLPAFRVVFGNIDELMAWSFDGEKWAYNEEHAGFFKNVLFDCVDFLVRSNDDEFEYVMAVQDKITEADTAPFPIKTFSGGLYAMAMSINDDDESIGKVEFKIVERLEKSTNFEYDDTRGVLGTMPYLDESEDDEIKKGLGYHQLLRLVPIKLKAEGAL